MATNRTEADARNLLEGLKDSLLKQAEEIDRDLADLDRIADKYGLLVVGKKAAETPSTRTVFVPESVIINGTEYAGNGPVAAAVRTVAEEYLRQTGTRAMSSAIAKVIADKGINVLPKRVSSYLTRSSIFDNKPAYGGYGLAEWRGARTAPPATSGSKPHE